MLTSSFSEISIQDLREMLDLLHFPFSFSRLICDLHTCRTIHLFGRIQHTGMDEGGRCRTPANLQTIAGKWKFESGQGFDEFLKDRGIGKLSKYFYIIKC